MKKTIQIPEQLFREATIETYEEKADSGEMEKKFRMSISSNTPYKRYDWLADEEYWEVLDHDKGGMDESRLKAGLPILFNHRRDQHLGRAGSYSCDGKKCIVSDLKWSTSPFAQEKRADAMNGSLPDTSVGYQITDEGECIGAKDGLPVYKFKWAPFEASLVTVPADISVGVGRQREKPDSSGLREISIEIKDSIDTGNKETQKSATKPTAMADPVTEPAAPNLQVVREAETKGAADERKRITDIQDLNQHFATKGLGGQKVDTTEIAATCIREGKTVQEFQDIVLRTELKPVKPIEVPEIGMSEKEKGEFSFCRAILQLKRNQRLDGLEKEANDAHAKLIGREINGLGFYIPQDVMRARAFPKGVSREELERMAQNPHTRALFANIYAAAGGLVGVETLGGSLIELLRNQMYVAAVGAREMTGLRGDVAIPKQTGGATASWMAEDSTHTATNQTVGQLNLKPHKLMAATAYTEQLLEQASIDVENFVRQDLMAIVAIERDRAAINGSGVSGEPTGIFNTTGVGTVQLASADSLTYAKAIAFETTVAQSNALKGKLAYLVSPAARAVAKQLAEISAASANPVWKDGMINGYRAETTNQIPSAGVVYGNWDDLILASWADMGVLVNPYSLDMSSQIRVSFRMYCDNGIRHAQSFVKAVL